MHVTRESASLKVNNTSVLKYKALEQLIEIKKKQFYEYFSHWQRYTQQSKEVMRIGMKGKILQVYLKKLEYAFNQWVNYRGHTILQERREINRDWELDNKVLGNEIKQECLIIDETKFQQQTRAVKCLKVLIMETF